MCFSTAQSLRGHEVLVDLTSNVSLQAVDCKSVEDLPQTTRVPPEAGLTARTPRPPQSVRYIGIGTLQRKQGGSWYIIKAHALNYCEMFLCTMMFSSLYVSI